MNVWSLDSIFIFIAFVIPGFVALKAYELFLPAPQRPSSGKVLDAITYSCALYAIAGAPLYWMLASQSVTSSPRLFITVLVFVLFIIPVLASYLWSHIRKSRFLQDIAPHPTLKPWDYVFSQRKPYWVKIYTTDDHIYAGKFGGRSFASSAPAEEEIFLEESWIVNPKGGLERPKNDTAGVIVLKGQIRAVELLNLYSD